MTKKSLQPPSEDRFQRIYGGDQTALYDAMVLCEDVENNLLTTLTALAQPENARVLDVGAGTGRVSRLLAPSAAQIISVDLNLPMLRIAQKHQRQATSEWHIINADATLLPVRAKWADLCVAGWVFGHFSGWFENSLILVDRAVTEMARVLKSSGTQIIIETLGTASEQPAPPSEHLAVYYAHLEKQHGFQRETIRTDYRFPDVTTGAELIKFFFGDAMSQQLITANSPRLIEWTGLWWRKV